jgi:hypothetical protein
MRTEQFSSTYVITAYLSPYEMANDGVVNDGFIPTFYIFTWGKSPPSVATRPGASKKNASTARKKVFLRNNTFYNYTYNTVELNDSICSQ